MRTDCMTAVMILGNIHIMLELHLRYVQRKRLMHICMVSK